MAAGRIDQDMALAAADLVPATVDKELRTRYRQLRVMLHTAGLAATYAFVASKANAADDGGEASLPKAYERVAGGIRERLAHLGVLTGDPKQASHAEVFRALGEADAATYARASTDVAALAGWLSRLADAVFQRDAQRGSNPEARRQ